MAQIDNGGGPVELTAPAVSQALSLAKQTGTGNNIILKLDYTTKAPGAYPILLVTYEIACSKGKDAAKAKLLQSFLKSFASSSEQAKLVTIGYATASCQHPRSGQHRDRRPVLIPRHRLTDYDCG